jgi:hypothetical protein
MFGPLTRYLFIVRHPLDNVLSLHETFANGDTDDADIAEHVTRHGRAFDGWARYWLRVNTALVDFAEARPESSCLVRYEDLVQSPDRCMAAVFLFLGEDAPEDIVTRAFAQPHSAGYGDPKIAHTHTIHTASVGRGRCVDPATAEAVWAVVAPLAGRLGYQRDPGDVSSAEGRIAAALSTQSRGGHK